MIFFFSINTQNVERCILSIDTQLLGFFQNEENKYIFIFKPKRRKRQNKSLADKEKLSRQKGDKKKKEGSAKGYRSL